MAHNLYLRNGKAAMMYVEKVPWHGLGTKLDKPATATEAIEAAGLDWQVVKRPLYAAGNGVLCEVPNRVAIMREDMADRPDAPVFAIVGDNYTPLQNRDAFAFFDSIVGANAAIYHTAGALGHGERIWILAKLPDSIRVAGDDITDKYLLLSNSHDGDSSVQIKFTPIRVVCQNTLTLALEDGPTLRVHHRKDLPKRLQDAGDLLGLIRNEYVTIEKSFKQMARTPLDSRRLSEYLKAVFPDPRPASQATARRAPVALGLFLDEPAASLRRAWKRVLLNREWAAHFFEHGRGNNQPGVKGTLWAAYNGVAELIDHRQNGLNADRHLRSMWFGEGYHIKARAHRAALDCLATSSG